MILAIWSKDPGDQAFKWYIVPGESQVYPDPVWMEGWASRRHMRADDANNLSRECHWR